MRTFVQIANAPCVHQSEYPSHLQVIHCLIFVPISSILLLV